MCQSRLIAVLCIPLIALCVEAKGGDARPEDFVPDLEEIHKSIAGADEPAPYYRAKGADPDLGITEIGLQRTLCYGACPIYKVVLYSDGKVHFEGKRNVKRKGQHAGVARSEEFRRLAELIVDSGFMDLEPTYARKAMDGPSVYTSVVVNGKRKVVRNYMDSAPRVLWAIEQIIDKLVLETKWD